MALVELLLVPRCLVSGEGRGSPAVVILLEDGVMIFTGRSGPLVPLLSVRGFGIAIARLLPGESPERKQNIYTWKIRMSVYSRAM